MVRSKIAYLPQALLLAIFMGGSGFAVGAADQGQDSSRAVATGKASSADETVPVFRPDDRAVSTWRNEAADHLVLTADQAAALRGPSAAPSVARCVKLNNYWCIKRAGWDGEISADAEGHVAFASAVEGAAVAALLLKRYYVDFRRQTAMAIISRWAPAQCGGLLADRTPKTRRVAAKTSSSRGLSNTLRARWLAGHARGFVTPVGGKAAPVRRSIVATRVPRMMPTPAIATGLGEMGKPSRPITLDALLSSSPNAPPSRSMLGMPRGGRARPVQQPGSVSGCGYDGPRIAAYAAKAGAGIETGPGADLALFTEEGTPTPNLAIMMENMARVEIGPLGPSRRLIEDGIAEAFKPGHNPGKS